MDAITWDQIIRGTPLVVALVTFVVWAIRNEQRIAAIARRIDAVETRIAKVEDTTGARLDKLCEEVQLTRRDVAALAAQIKMLLELRREE